MRTVSDDCAVYDLRLNFLKQSVVLPPTSPLLSIFSPQHQPLRDLLTTSALAQQLAAQCPSCTSPASQDRRISKSLAALEIASRLQIGSWTGEKGNRTMYSCPGRLQNWRWSSAETCASMCLQPPAQRASVRSPGQAAAAVFRAHNLLWQGARPAHTPPLSPCPRLQPWPRPRPACRRSGAPSSHAASSASTWLPCLPRCHHLHGLPRIPARPG